MIAAELETLGKLATKALHKKEGAPAAASPTARDAQAAGQPTSPLSPELRCVQLQGGAAALVACSLQITLSRPVHILQGAGCFTPAPCPAQCLPHAREEEHHLLESEHGLSCQHGVAGACAACQAARASAGSGA